MIPSPAAAAAPFSRRGFLKRSAALAGSLAAANLLSVRAEDAPTPSPAGTRFVFLTDIHLMLNDALGCDKGLAACLDAVEKLNPRPEFILCGGDLTHESPALDPSGGEKLINRFFEIWHAHTSLPAHFAFGNHDFVGVKNPLVKRDDPLFGKGLWKQKVHLEKPFYGFDAGGWRILVLDDVQLNGDGSYTGEFPEEQLAFLADELKAAAGKPLVLCGHIPSVSVFPTVAGLAKLAGAKMETASSLVATNTKAVLDVFKDNHQALKLVLAGHLHHYEEIELDGIRYINSGAVCGNWWKGLHMGCPEGFLVVDLQVGGKFTHAYQPYGWNAQTQAVA